MNHTVVFIVLAVNFLEWLEFSLYLYMAKSVFAVEFFPHSSGSLMLTFAVFAGAYLARPLGGWLFGRIADLKGRRQPMMFTAALMGFATFGICLLPGYAQIGSLATWLLLFCRILQGLALGGEINTSAMFTIEHHPNNPLLAGSLVAAFGALGMFFGGVFAALIQWGDVPGLWRVVFAGIGIISLGVCRLRKQLSESPEFKAHAYAPNTSTSLLKTHWRGMVNIAAVALFVSVTVYLCNIFWLAFATQLSIWTSVQCAWIAAFAQLGSAMFALPIARFSRPEHGIKLLQLGMLVIILAAPALFYFTHYANKPGIILGLMGYMLANGLLCASFYYFLYQQLPTHVRCRGVSIIWALAASLGALTLPIAQQAVFTNHLYWAPGFMVSAIVLSTLLIIRINLKKSQKTSEFQALYD